MSPIPRDSSVLSVAATMRARGARRRAVSTARMLSFSLSIQAMNPAARSMPAALNALSSVGSISCVRFDLCMRTRHRQPAPANKAARLPSTLRSRLRGSGHEHLSLEIRAAFPANSRMNSPKRGGEKGESMKY